MIPPYLSEKGVRYLFLLYSPCPADDPALSVRSSREKVPDLSPPDTFPPPELSRDGQRLS